MTDAATVAACAAVYTELRAPPYDVNLVIAPFAAKNIAVYAMRFAAPLPAAPRASGRLVLHGISLLVGHRRAAHDEGRRAAAERRRFRGCEIEPR